MISYFEYKGKKSSDFGIRIYNDLEFITPTKDIEEVKVLGRDGVLLYDNERLEVVEKTINFDVRDIEKADNGSDGSKIFNRVLEISKWLSSKAFINFKYSMYPGFTFKAAIHDTYNIKDTLRNLGRGSVRVKFQPYMYYNDGLKEIEVPNQTNLNNLGITSYPRIRVVPIKAGETMEIYNNGKLWLKLQDLEFEITLDSELMQAYDVSGNASGKIMINRPLYPELYTGENWISYDSTLCKVYVMPRYREAII